MGIALALFFFAAPARAQIEVSATAKGTVGCALLGAELPLIVESIVGVQNGWVLGLSALGGAVGGGLAGFFLVEAGTLGSPVELSVGSLVIGMVLIIPTVGLVVNATSYHPEESDSFVEVNPEDEVDADAGASGSAEDGAVQGGFNLGGSTGGGGQETPEGGTPAPPPERRPSPGPTGSLIIWDAGTLALSVPGIALRPETSTRGSLFALSLASGRF